MEVLGIPKTPERNYRKARLLWHATKGEGHKVKEILNERQGESDYAEI